MPELFVRNGAIYLVRSDYMIKEKKVFDEKPAMYVMPKERSVNIDTMEDIYNVRKVIGE
jgi:CMP-N-acetylneuraminic acid synthetase